MFKNKKLFVFSRPLFFKKNKTDTEPSKKIRGLSLQTFFERYILLCSRTDMYQINLVFWRTFWRHVFEVKTAALIKIVYIFNPKLDLSICHEVSILTNVSTPNSQSSIFIQKMFFNDRIRLLLFGCYLPWYPLYAYFTLWSCYRLQSSYYLASKQSRKFVFWADFEPKSWVEIHWNPAK